MEIVIERADIRSPEALRLLAAINTELSALYPEQGANHFRLDAEEVAPDRGGFFIARSGGAAVGCGAIRRIDAATGEVKRMYVVPASRGRGVSKVILAALEADARRLGLTRLCLETGARQPAAIALYERAGFTRTAPWGEYVHSPLSVCMVKEFPRD